MYIGTTQKTSKQDISLFSLKQNVKNECLNSKDCLPLANCFFGCSGVKYFHNTGSLFVLDSERL